MSEQLEIEYKNILTEKEFKLLIDYFQLQQSDFFLQENDYFDTVHFSLKNANSALRVRKKSNQYTLTLKQPHDVGLLETNEEISKEQYQELKQNIRFPVGEIANKLQFLNIDVHDIVYFGTLQTWRAELPYLDGLLVFDHSFYLNKNDFELEYEVEDANIGRKQFLDLLNQFHIPIRKTDNKIVRFYNEKRNISNKI
ncbi:CYTH domain-containing protein [Bacillus kwashiorkori]|uniref:CYTH domain-containing protein n=1 Tax=Bacillus kwashiorkori TaxID=1522318 RepID=UPI0007855F3D|nr:CYTH domain-containing protein [Bacillus kwashiorkori]